MSRETVIKSMVEAVETAKACGAQGVGIMPKMLCSDIDYLIEFALAGKAGAERFRYCDTLGYDSPFTIYERIAKIGKADAY